MIWTKSQSTAVTTIILILALVPSIQYWIRSIEPRNDFPSPEWQEKIRENHPFGIDLEEDD